MKKLSKQTESRLMAAIEKAAQNVNGGDDPNTAIVKAAQEHSIPAGNVHLMVHAYNTGRTTRQRQEGDTVWDKAAEFDLADQAVVAEMLYPTHVKTSAAIAEASAVDPAYGISPAGLLGRRQQREKAARTIDWKAGFGDAPPAYPRDPRAAMRKAASEVDRGKKQVDELRRQAAAAFDKAASTFRELTEYFRSPGCQPIPVVRENVMLMHGNAGTRVLDELIRITPGLAKMAMHRVQPAVGRLPPASGQAYGLVARLIDELTTFNECDETHTKTAAQMQQQAEVLLRPFVQPAVSESILSDRFSAKRAASLGSTVGHAALLKNIFDFAGGHMKAPDPGPAINANFNELTDPDHEAELRKVRVQSMLQDLMLNDPVIGGHDPEDAAMAYNDVVEMAPHLADQRLAIQTLMRKRLTQGALDPFEVDQLLGLEGKIRSNRQPTPAPKLQGGIASASGV